jgi:type II secretory pathway component PulL
VESQKVLGIYLRKNSASIVCIETRDGKSSIADSFCVSTEDREEQNIQVLINLIGEKTAEKRLLFSETAVALDCSLFIQHKIHSEFKDPKQIAQTMRFDAEEALARDVSDIAIAFKINSSDETGSELTIFTAEKNLLADIIASLQSNKMDPVTIEPDANCLKRFLSEKLGTSETEIVAMLSKHNAYIVTTGSSEDIQRTPARTFLLGIKKDRTLVLQREVPISAAILESENIDALRVCDFMNSLDLEVLKESLAIRVESIDLFEILGTDQDSNTADQDQIESALAYGAALAVLNKMDTIDFRSDFLPYQAKRQKLQKAIRFLSISCTILLFVTGVFVQTKWFQNNKPVKELQNRFNTQYAAIMGRQPDKRTNPNRQLERELMTVKNEKSGQLGIAGTESLTARLTRILLAFNNCAAQTNLNIDSLNITTKTVVIAGSTSNRRNTLKLRNSLQKNGLQIVKDSLEPGAGKDNFRLTIEIK